jgi:hypothetical protein
MRKMIFLFFSVFALNAVAGHLGIFKQGRQLLIIEAVNKDEVAPAVIPSASHGEAMPVQASGRLDNVGRKTL